MGTGVSMAAVGAVLLVDRGVAVDPRAEAGMAVVAAGAGDGVDAGDGTGVVGDDGVGAVWLEGAVGAGLLTSVGVDALVVGAVLLVGLPCVLVLCPPEGWLDMVVVCLRGCDVASDVAAVIGALDVD